MGITRPGARMDMNELSPEPAAIGTDGASEAARRRPGQAEIEAAVRTLIAAAGDDPAREGLAETPARVARAYREWFAGYRVDPLHLLNRTFGEAAGYDETVLQIGRASCRARVCQYV